MKKKFFSFAVAAAALTMASCEKQEVSHADLNAYDRIKIEGTVTYNYNKEVKAENATLVQAENVPAENVNVFVYVDLQKYGITKNANEGVKEYTVTTDADGRYSIEIPCVKGKEVSAKVKVEFQTETYANHSYTNADNEEKWEAKKLMAIFKSSDIEVVAKSGQTDVVNIQAEFEGFTGDNNILWTHDGKNTPNNK